MAEQQLRSSSFDALLFKPFYTELDANEPLDIVDTMGILNIDEEDETHTDVVSLLSDSANFSNFSANVSASASTGFANVSGTSASTAVPSTSTAASTGAVASISNTAATKLVHEASTLNAPPLAALRAPNTIGERDTTPATTWGSTFVPFSTPPFAYPVTDPLLTSQMTTPIAPVALPDKTGSRPAPVTPLGYLHEGIPGFVLPPQHARQFGGVLGLRMSFDKYFNNTTAAAVANNNEYARILSKHSSPDGSKSLEEKSLAAECTESTFYPPLGSHLEALAPLSLSGMSLWNQRQMFMLHGSSLGAGNDGLDDQFDAYYSGPNQNNNGSPSNGGGSHENNLARFHNIQGSHADNIRNFHGNVQHGAYKGGKGHHVRYTREHLGPIHSSQDEYRRQQYSSANVHRKLNTHRKKGDTASKYANAALGDFVGDIYSLCKDQHGCRFLQRQLDLARDGSGDAAAVIFAEIHSQIVELMVDPFGNYLVQKLFECITPQQRLVLVRTAAPDNMRIALDPHGTRALQKLVEQISTPEETQYIIDSLAPHVVVLSRDLNGNHVVQKCLQRLPSKDSQFVFDAASKHCAEIAIHRHGCCVLQRCLDHGNSAQREQLSCKVAQIATTLSLDPYGNYVVQYVVARGDEASVETILAHIRKNIVALSLHKFGSNVIEKTLRTRRLSDAVIDVLLARGTQLHVLLNDPFGNYVLQTALDVAGSGSLDRLAQGLQPHLPSIKNTPHGRRIYSKIQHIL